LFNVSAAANHLSPLMPFTLLGGELPLGMMDLSAMHPTTEESNTLIKLFFKSVNPFIRVLHQGLFGRELEQYRRGVFFLPREFEALLFSIYTLAVSSLRPEIVEKALLTQKNVLLGRFQHAAQVALSSVNFYKTDKILTLQALLHYVVSGIKLI
jgi:hypothetical protein